MTRFGDSANGPSVLDISNISGVSADIDTLAGYTTELSNLGPVSTEIGLLGTAAVVADMSALGTQAVRDDMDALADVTTELGVLGNATTAGYIAAIGSSTVAGSNPAQLTVDALGQLTSEISLLASNLSTLQASAANSPIQLANLSDVDFGGNTPSLGNTIVYTSNNKFELQALPGAGPLSGTNLTETSPQTDQILKISAVNAGVPEYVNTTVSALVYDAAFDNITEVAAATPAAAGEVLHYDGTSAWTVGKLDYAEILNRPTNVSAFTNDAGYLTSYTETNDLSAAVTWANVPDQYITSTSVTQHVTTLATSANFADITEASASGTAGDVIRHNGTIWTQGQLASTELSDTGTLVRNNANSTLTGDYTVDGNLDVTNGEIRVDTIDPDPHGNTGTLTILGNLQVDGTTTTINSATLEVNDKSVTLSAPASGNTTFSAMNGAGIDVDTTGMSAVWTTNIPAITYSTTSAGNAADAQTWDINRGVVAKGWSDGTSSYDGQLTLNCSANSHGITIKSAPHADNATYDLILPASAPAAGQVLAQNSNNDQLEFIDVVKPNSAAALTSLTTQNGSNSVSVRQADVRTDTGTHTLVGGASLYYSNANATYDTANLTPGDIVTIYCESGTVTVNTGGTVSLFKDGEASAVTAAVTIGADTLATVTCVSATKAIIAGSDLT